MEYLSTKSEEIRYKLNLILIFKRTKKKKTFHAREPRRQEQKKDPGQASTSA